MVSLDKDTRNIVMGILIGGIVGVGAAILIASKHGKGNKGPMELIEKTMCHLNKILESYGQEGKSILHEVNKKVEKDESSIACALEWVMAGMNLYNKLKKGA